MTAKSYNGVDAGEFMKEIKEIIEKKVFIDLTLKLFIYFELRIKIRHLKKNCKLH